MALIDGVFLPPICLELQDLFSIIASVLHLGNIRFEADGRGYACTSGHKETHWVSKVRLKQV